MFGRKKPSLSHRQQLLDELAESYGHLRLAAGHIAGGAAEKATPTYDKARTAATRGWSTTVGTFTPLYDQMKEGAAIARKEKKVPKRKWPIIVGLLAAGAAAGAAGAMVARHRRTAAQWDEYEPLPAIDDVGYGNEGPSQKVAAGAASMADSVSSQAGKIADSLNEKSGRHGAGSPAPSDKSSKGAGSGTYSPFNDESDATSAKNSRS